MKRLILVALILATAFQLTGCGKSKSRAQYEAVPVKRGNIQLTVLETGNVQPNNELNVFPAINGRIEKILVKEGQYVKKGQTLMILSSTERATLLDEAEAQGPKEYAYWEKLEEPMPLLSPENGQIIYLPTVPGQVVSTGVTMLVMSDHLIVNTQVDETDLSQIHLNQNATITLDAYPDQPFDGTVRRISYFATLVNDVTTYEVDVWPNQVPSFMRTGMTANVVFNTLDKKNVLLIPSIAIEQVNGQSGVLVPAPKRGDPPVFKPIETGATDGKETEVVSGLNQGERVLIKAFSISDFGGSQMSQNPFLPNFHHGGGKK